MRYRKTILIDLRKVGLSQEQWGELRLEAREPGVPMGILAEVAIADWLSCQVGSLSSCP